MRLGLVLITYVYNSQRAGWAKQSFASLGRTKLGKWEEPLLFIAKRNSSCGENIYTWPSSVIYISHDDPPRSSSSAVCYATDHVLETFKDVTHVCWLMDDCLYHPEWMQQLEKLVERHPDARSWSVFRSADTSWHKPIMERDGDVLVKSLSGESKTFTREEWEAFNPKWQEDPWSLPVPGSSLDIHHAAVRPGEYWCTRSSYIDHIGTVGEHVREGFQANALEFVGVE